MREETILIGTYDELVDYFKYFLKFSSTEASERLIATGLPTRCNHPFLDVAKQLQQILEQPNCKGWYLGTVGYLVYDKYIPGTDNNIPQIDIKTEVVYVRILTPDKMI